MNRIAKKKLALNSTTIRQLTTRETTSVIGAGCSTGTGSCPETCTWPDPPVAPTGK